MLALLTILGPFSIKSCLNYILLIIGKWLDIQAINKQIIGQGHTGRVVAIQTEPNVFPMTLATGGSGGRRQEKGTLSPQKEYFSQWSNQVSGPGNA
jgi:hypothetical protein